MLIRSALLVLFCFASCGGQTSVSFEWKTIEFTDARIRASLPCVPKISKKSFQDEPRPIQIYGFDCEIDGIRFSLSVKNHQNDFTLKTVSESFDSNEFLLMSMFGEVEHFSVRNHRTTKGYESRDYDVAITDGGKIRSLIVVNEFATYQALVGVTSENLHILGQKKLDFVKVSEKFFGSVEVLNK